MLPLVVAAASPIIDKRVAEYAALRTSQQLALRREAKARDRRRVLGRVLALAALVTAAVVASGARRRGRRKHAMAQPSALGDDPGAAAQATPALGASAALLGVPAGANAAAGVQASAGSSSAPGVSDSRSAVFSASTLSTSGGGVYSGSPAAASDEAKAGAAVDREGHAKIK